MATKKTQPPEYVRTNAGHVRLLADTMLRRRKISPSLRRLTVELFRQWLKSKQHGGRWISPGVRHLAKKLKVHIRTIQRGIEDLRDANILVLVDPMWWEALPREQCASGGSHENTASYYLNTRELSIYVQGSDALRDILMFRAWISPPPKKSDATGGSTGGRAVAVTGGTNGNIGEPNQRDTPIFSARSENRPSTGGDDPYFAEQNQCDVPSDTGDSALIKRHVHAELSSLNPSLAESNERARQEDEPQASIADHSPACCPLAQVRPDDLAGQNEAWQVDAFTVDCLTADAQDLLAHLELSGPSSYGAAASDLNWTPSRALQAEVELKSAGAIRHDRIGRMVPTQRLREAIPLPATFHEGNIS
jgi:hypothetical protein